MRQNFLDFLLSPKDLYCVLRTDEPKHALEHGKLCKSIVNKLCPNWIVLHSVALNCNKVHHTHIFTVKWCLNFKQLKFYQPRVALRNVFCLLIYWFKRNFSEVSGEILKSCSYEKELSLFLSGIIKDIWTYTKAVLDDVNNYSCLPVSRTITEVQ